MRCLKCGATLIGGVCPTCKKTVTRPLQSKGTKPFEALFGSKPSAAAMLAEGIELFDKGQYEEAILPLEKALELAPKDPQTLLLVGRTEAFLGEYPQAEQHLLRTSPTATSRYYLGDLFIRMGRYQEAEVALKQALKAQASHLEAQIALGDVYWAQDRKKEAQQGYEAAIKIEPSSGEARLGLARVLLDQGDRMRAMAQLHYASAAGIPEAFVLLGDLQLVLGNQRQAIIEYTKGIEKLPWDARLAEKLGNLHLAMGDRRKGLRWLRKAIRLDASLEASMLTVAGLIEKRLPPLAVSYYKQLAANPNYSETAAEALIRLEHSAEEYDANK